MAKVCQPTGILSKKESSSFSSTLNSPSPLIQQSSPSWKSYCHQSKFDLFFSSPFKNFKLLSQMFRFDHDKESSDNDDEVHTLETMTKIPIWKLWHKANKPSSSNISDFTRPGPSASCCAGGPNSRNRRRSGQSGCGNQDDSAQQSWQRSRMFNMHMQLQNCMGCRRAQFAKMARSSSGRSGNSSSSSASTSSSGCSPSSSD